MDNRKKEYYAILEVTQEASEEEIKQSFRRLALQYHPDRTNGDLKTGEHFKEINEAYSVLSNPEKRRYYDMTGDTDYPDPLRTGFTRTRQGFGRNANCCERKSGFGNFFSHKSMGIRTHRNIYSLPLTHEEALQGVQKSVIFNFKGTPQRLDIRTPAGLEDGDNIPAGVINLGPSTHEIVFRVTISKSSLKSGS